MRRVRSVQRAVVDARPEVHLSHRSNWLRAAVLGANDGILSTASLVLGVAASGGQRSQICSSSGPRNGF
jgi:VIT1/CCC1 family predicted Fe2+/Mn2+ transporter